MLDLLVVFCGEFVEHVFCVVSLDYHLLVLFLQNGYLLLQRFHVLLVTLPLLFEQFQLIECLPVDLLYPLLAALELILLVSF